MLCEGFSHLGLRATRLFLFVLLLGFLLGARPSSAGYVGSQSCLQCHPKQAEAWRNSHHAWAWQLPNEKTVLGDFNDVRVPYHGGTAQFTTRRGDFFVTLPGPKGTPKEFKVHSVASVMPLQQYLLETEPGRLQALDLVWDTEGKRWYLLYPHRKVAPGDAQNWDGTYSNWNSRCAECHATGYVKNYDSVRHLYHSIQAEMGVGCEACHGPGERHAKWAKTYKQVEKGATKHIKLGLQMNFDPSNARKEIHACAQCHSRREPYSDKSPIYERNYSIIS